MSITNIAGSFPQSTHSNIRGMSGVPTTVPQIKQPYRLQVRIEFSFSSYFDKDFTDFEKALLERDVPPGEASWARDFFPVLTIVWRSDYCDKLYQILAKVHSSLSPNVPCQHTISMVLDES